jgi:hypothetical protein
MNDDQCDNTTASDDGGRDDGSKKIRQFCTGISVEQYRLTVVNYIETVDSNSVMTVATTRSTVYSAGAVYCTLHASSVSWAIS